MHEAARAQKILETLSKHYKEYTTELRYEQEWQLLVAVMLSAQTTDNNVNKTTPTLFNKYRTIKALAQAENEELERLTYSTGYYKSKSRNLKAMATTLIKQYDGRVPDTMEALTSLPGVGRKTANVVMQVLHKKTSGIVMDTHISRVTHRLGFTKKKNPEQAEQNMMAILPRKDWKRWGDLLIQHGRKTCQAKKPLCQECPINNTCPRQGITT